MGLHTKLAQVMYMADRIPKNGKAPVSMGGYDFVQVGDAADVIRKALAEQGVSMLPTAIECVEQSEHETKSGGTMTTMTVRTTWTLTDGESGESAVIQSMGTGADAGDKYSPKAQTNAMKYALLMGFLLSTGDDPEGATLAERKPNRAPTPAPTPLGAVAAVPEPARTADGSLIGTVAIGSAWLEDCEVRTTPEGPGIGFRLKSGRQTQKVQAFGPLAMALGGLGTGFIGQTVTCWGTLVGESFTPKGTTMVIDYQILRLERIHGATFDIPAPEGSALPDDPDDLECGDVAAPGTLMDGAACIQFPAHPGPHKSASGSWPR